MSTRNTMERFWSRVKPMSNGCWLWQTTTDGRYGTFPYAGTVHKAHRFAYAMTKGRIPEGMEVCHRCDTTLCCNPAHLFLGTHADNMADMVAKGRVGRGQSQGHSRFTEDDIREMRRLRAEGMRTPAIAARYGTDTGNVSRIVRGLTWRHVL